MSHRILKTVALLSLLPLAGAASAPKGDASPVHGDYLEVRTASVFCGACHYNGERVTEGRSALLAWHFSGGSVDGIDLTGVNVMAAVACQNNLAEPGAARQAEMIVEGSEAQAHAATDWLKVTAGDSIGRTFSIRRGPVTFNVTSEGYTARAAGFGALQVQPLPDAACCSQPHLVWYKPLMTISNRRVGCTITAGYTAGRIGDAWQRSDENSAFYGKFGR